MSTLITGIPVSSGIVIAKAYPLVEPPLTFTKEKITGVEQECDRFNEARKKAYQDVEGIYANAKRRLASSDAEIFQAHLQMLDDPEFNGEITALIKNEQVNAEYALDTVAKKFITLFEAMTDNAYMQERASDIRDISKRLMSHLLGVMLPDLREISEEVILVADDLTPSDTAQLNKAYIQGFVTNAGGRTSHSAIMARSLEIPAIVGTDHITKHVQAGDLLVIDALEGEVIINPSSGELEKYQLKKEAHQKRQEQWKHLIQEPARSKDGVEVTLAANIGSPKDLLNLEENGAEAVGLYRTEFLYMDSQHMPSEEEQFKAYKEVIQALQGQSVVIRTLDIGGDKKLPYLDLPREMNPFLGYRAIRLCLGNRELFMTQLRALARASAYGPLNVMFPMIASVEEFREAKALMQEAKNAVQEEGHDVGELALGIMVEIPATAILAEQFAKEVDFFSIGTNDLIQYTMACDRMNQQVSYLYQPYHPALLKLIRHIVKASHQEGKWTGMCGEMASDPLAIPLLLGMGLDEFSMSATSLPQARAIIRALDTREMAALVDKIIDEAQTADEVLHYIHDEIPELQEILGL